MIERQKRLNEVYQYLRQNRGIHTKTDFAEVIRYGRTSMSAALNGNESYLTDSLFRNICDAFPNTFNLQYLLRGEGELLIHHDTIPPTNQKEQSEKDIISLATDLIVELEALRRQTQNELALLVQARQSFDSATQELQKLIQSTHTKHPIDYFPGLAAENTENK